MVEVVFLIFIMAQAHGQMLSRQKIYFANAESFTAKWPMGTSLHAGKRGYPFEQQFHSFQIYYGQLSSQFPGVNPVIH
jgi:hypothetical protein